MVMVIYCMCYVGVNSSYPCFCNEFLGVYVSSPLLWDMLCGCVFTNNIKLCLIRLICQVWGVGACMWIIHSCAGTNVLIVLFLIILLFSFVGCDVLGCMCKIHNFICTISPPSMQNVLFRYLGVNNTHLNLSSPPLYETLCGHIWIIHRN